jgi:predicted nucleotidyltransferase
MRLEKAQIEAILQEIRSFDPLAEVWLFGSRVHDDLKGGDIDLLIISSKIGFSEKISILVQIKMAIGDQKIDLLVRKPEAKLNDPLVLSILQGAVPLCK